MLLIRTRRCACILISSFIAVLAVSFIACQKEITGNPSGFTPVLPDLTTKVSSSVTGFVTDENDLAVAGAVVTIGGSTTITDKFGFFEIKNVLVIKEAAVLSVARPGYFNGAKTYLATEGKTSFFRIKLIPKINAGSVGAATGGIVTLSNGLIINLPAAGVVNAATNISYTGQVNVAAHWINPTANDLNRTMPGDLRGLDSVGAMKLLTTYGMAAVEITGSAGELLQIAAGKKATLTIPIPTAITAGAPSSIPLWYFDEISGLWKQQGNAVKSGNNYTGDVSHFSFWNCDAPSSFTSFNCTVINTTGKPVQNALVKISVVTNPQNACYGYTDSSGYVGGAVPGNAQLLLQVFNEYNCSTALYSQNFTSAGTSIALRNITVAASNSASVTGTVINCSNTPVTNGFVIMVKDGLNFHYKLGSNGTFSLSTILCTNTTEVTLIAEDIDALEDSQPFTTMVTAGQSAIGSLRACGTITDEFINYNVNDTSYFIAAPGDSLQQQFYQSSPPSINIDGYSMHSGVFASAGITFMQQGIALNSRQLLTTFLSNHLKDSSGPLLPNSVTMPAPINVNITEYGVVGQFIAGNFTGTLTGPPPGNTNFNVTCSFRVRRDQ